MKNPESAPWGVRMIERVYRFFHARVYLIAYRWPDRGERWFTESTRRTYDDATTEADHIKLRDPEIEVALVFEPFGR